MPSAARRATKRAAIRGDLPRINGELHLRWSGANLAADPNWFSTALAGTPGRPAPESIVVRPHPRPEMEAALPKCAYFPFGAGPRLCIGEPFAWTEAILLLATLSQYWEVHLAPDARIEFQPAVTLRPKFGVKMTLHKRVPAVVTV